MVGLQRGACYAQHMDNRVIGVLVAGAGIVGAVLSMTFVQGWSPFVGLGWNLGNARAFGLPLGLDLAVCVALVIVGVAVFVNESVRTRA